MLQLLQMFCNKPRIWKKDEGSGCNHFISVRFCESFHSSDTWASTPHDIELSSIKSIWTFLSLRLLKTRQIKCNRALSFFFLFSGGHKTDSVIKLTPQKRIDHVSRCVFVLAGAYPFIILRSFEYLSPEGMTCHNLSLVCVCVLAAVKPLECN